MPLHVDLSGASMSPLQHHMSTALKSIVNHVMRLQAGVIMGDLQAHWGTYYVDAESNGYEDSDSDGSPVPR